MLGIFKSRTCYSECEAWATSNNSFTFNAIKLWKIIAPPTLLLTRVHKLEEYYVSSTKLGSVVLSVIVIIISRLLCAIIWTIVIFHLKNDLLFSLHDVYARARYSYQFYRFNILVRLIFFTVYILLSISH